MMKKFRYSWSAYGYGEIEADHEEAAYEKIYDMEDELMKQSEGFSVDFMDEIVDES